MKVRSWLATCSSAAGADAPAPRFPETRPLSLNLLLSETSSVSEVQESSSTSRKTSSSSLHGNLSLQTHPSLPSLQKLSPETLNLSVSHAIVTSIKPRTFRVTSLATAGNFLYTACGNEINVYDLATYALVDSFNGIDSSSGAVKSVCFSNGRVFTAHQDCKIRVWRLTASKRHKFIATLPTINDRLRRCIISKNYTTVRRHKKRLWIEHADAVSGLAVNAGLLYSVSWDKSLKIWQASDLHCLESIKAHDDAINAVVVSADGTVYTGSADKRIKVWAFGKKRHALVATLEKHKSAVNALALNGDGAVLFSGSCDRSILVWEREDSAHYMVVTGALRGHDRAILCLVNVSDFLFSGSADRTVRIWKRGSGGRYCCLAVLDGHEKPVRSLTAVPAGDSSDSVTVFSGSFDGEIKVWQVFILSLNSSPLDLFETDK